MTFFSPLLTNTNSIKTVKSYVLKRYCCMVHNQITQLCFVYAHLLIPNNVVARKEIETADIGESSWLYAGIRRVLSTHQIQVNLKK